MKIHQFVHTLAYGDAISSEALTIKKLLRQGGIESEIYTVNVHPHLRGEARSWELFAGDLAQPANGPVAVALHFSIASPLNRLFRESTGVRRAAIYHNLTPASWFQGYNARVTADLRAARGDLAEVIASADIVLADSQFNLEEVRAHCRAKAFVLELPLDGGKWSCAANPGIAAVLKSNGCKNILHVGRIAPNKRLEDVIKIFYFYHHKIERQSKLWLIGSDVDAEIYSFELHSLIAELRLSQAVNMAGTVADTELRAFYENCDLYLCMSEHEGFCVPLIEAMHFGLPVIAYDSCAVGGTVGDGGLVVTRKEHALIAELAALVTQEGGVRSALVEAGKRRARRFDLETFRRRLWETLVDPLASSWMAPP